MKNVFPSLFSRRCTAAVRLAAVALPMLLAGCAGLTPPDAGTLRAESARAAGRSYQDSIDLDGRLSVLYRLNGEDQALHGSFTWHQTLGHSQVALLSPLGQTLAVIDVRPYGATLTQSGDVTRAAADVDALAAQSLGWPLPVSGLRTWLQGFAVQADGRPFVATPAADRVVTRDGWRIHYVTWDDSDPAHILPKRIDLERQTEQAGDVVIRLVIDDWHAR